MSLNDRLTADLKTAMKAKEKDKLTLIRSVKAEFKKREIDDGPLTEEAEVQILLKMIKQRREAAAGFRKGGAEERALNEDREAEQLEGYLPPPPTDEEIEQGRSALGGLSWLAKQSRPDLSFEVSRLLADITKGTRRRS